MKIVLILLVLVWGTACQTGKIPCPKPKYVKAKKTVIRKNFAQAESSMSARAAEREDDKPQTRGARGTESKMIHNISVEEWDCPRPGTRKYMPRSVRDNIRKNLKKLKQDDKESKRDSAKVRQ